MSFADLDKTVLLEFVKNFTILKKVQKSHQLIQGKIFFCCYCVLVDHLETKCFLHVLFGVEPVGVLRELADHMDVVFVPLVLWHLRHLSEELQVLVHVLLVIRQLSNKIVDLLYYRLMLANPWVPNDVHVLRLQEISQDHELCQLAWFFYYLKVVVELEEDIEEVRLVDPDSELVVFSYQDLMALANLNDVTDALEFSLEVRAQDHLETQGQLQHGGPLLDRLTVLGSPAESDQSLDESWHISPMEFFDLRVFEFVDVVISYLEQGLDHSFAIGGEKKRQDSFKHVCECWEEEERHWIFFFDDDLQQLIDGIRPFEGDQKFWDMFFIILFDIFGQTALQELPQMILVILEKSLKSLIIAEDDVSRIEDLIEGVVIGFSFRHIFLFFASRNLFHVLSQSWLTSLKF